MRVLGADEVARLLTFDALVPALREAFTREVKAPLRHQHTAGAPGTDARLLLMPAWSDRYIGVKLVNVFPHNGDLDLPAVSPVYVLSSATTGEQYAVIDGAELTRRRTAAASALAASYLAREDASRLLVVGAGQVARVVPHAYRAVRPIERVLVWNRTVARADALADDLRADGFDAERADDLEAAVHAVDVVSCATLAAEPLVRGDWLDPGVHLDLIGSFAPYLRETDDTALHRATVFVDTDDALAESGDLIEPLASGALSRDQIAATLHDLTAGRHAGRAYASEITLFKSVGTAIEDLAAGALAYESSRQQS
ncbi:MAG: ornithine cyclodeaminase family protein [Streptosporangiales bacterium]|nr:ornithine cyclodeaminase family protein [Streptosporangiales bacterium]